jgi:ribosomal protein L15E
MPTRDWRRVLDYTTGARLVVRYTHESGVIVDYAVVLVMPHHGTEQTIRVYDGAHGINDIHRHTRSRGKASAEHFHRGTLAEGMRIAIDAIETGYREMIDGWRAS